ncbi:MAG TPA: hypothetical protein VMM12_18200, partial [Longimicrobiales bacterium]|nr:hypothetical protein [Longimicrobiales bacterium]
LAASRLRLREAQRLMRRVVEEHPNDMEALEALAIWSIHIGDLAAARDVTEQRASTGLLGGTPPANHMLFAHAPERAAELGREAVARHPDHMEIVYQTHRVLLWVGDVEGASRLAARLTLPGENEGRAAIVAMRQACAEGDPGRAEAVFRTLTLGDDDLAGHWLLLKLLGRNAEADALLERLDWPESLYSLSAWLIYPYFDVTLYPQLAAVLAAQGVERPPLAFEPYRCAAA